MLSSQSWKKSPCKKRDTIKGDSTDCKIDCQNKGFSGLEVPKPVSTYVMVPKQFETYLSTLQSQEYNGYIPEMNAE